MKINSAIPVIAHFIFLLFGQLGTASEELRLIKPDLFLEHTELYWMYLLEQEPENPYYLYRLGKIYAQKKDYANAESLLRRSLKLNPKDADVKLSLAYLYLWTNRREEAQSLFQEILAAYPDYQEAKEGLKRVREQEKAEKIISVEQAGEIWNEAILDQEAEIFLELQLNKEPENAIYLYRLGKKYAQKGEYKKGEELLKRSLELSPDDADIKLALAYLYLWNKRAAEAEALFAKILEEYPDYVEAQEGLEKVKEMHAEKKKSSLLPWQDEWIKIADALEACYQYDRALVIWRFLFCSSSDENLHIFAARIGQVLSWKGRWRKAERFLNASLKLQSDYQPAKLRLAYVYLFSGCLHRSRSIFCSLLQKDSKDSDAWEGYARSSAALLCNCEAKRAYFCRLALAKPTFDLFKQMHHLLKWTDPWIEAGGLYAQERETDLITKVRSAQRNTAFGEAKLHFPLTPTSRASLFAYYGYEKEINLVQGIDNFDINIWKYGAGYDCQLCPRLTFRSWAAVKEADDAVDHSVFPLGRRRRFEPVGILLYSWKNLAASASVGRDSFIVKKFQDFKSTLLPRDTCEGQMEYALFNNQAFLGVLGFYRFYHEFQPNRQWEGFGWATLGFPKYKPCFYIQYKGRIGGFRFTETDYYSYSKQWEHFAHFYHAKKTILNSEYEVGYIRSWQWSRDLNQPINTAIFVPELFRITNRGYGELRHLYRPNFWIKARGEYYQDTTEYTAWIVRGEINIVF